MALTILSVVCNRHRPKPPREFLTQPMEIINKSTISKQMTGAFCTGPPLSWANDAVIFNFIGARSY